MQVKNSGAWLVVIEYNWSFCIHVSSSAKNNQQLSAHYVGDLQSENALDMCEMDSDDSLYTGEYANALDGGNNGMATLINGVVENHILGANRATEQETPVALAWTHAKETCRQRHTKRATVDSPREAQTRTAEDHLGALN